MDGDGEAKVRVRLDTSEAKAELRNLTKQGEAAGQRASGGLRRAVGRGFRLAGAGAAISAGIGAVRSASSSGLADLAGESLGGLGARLNEFFLGDIDDEARASKSARDATVEAFASIAGHRGSVPPEAKGFFDAVQSVRLQQERGRSLIEQDDRFRGPGIGSLVGKLADRIVAAISDAGEGIAARLEAALGSGHR